MPRKTKEEITKAKAERSANETRTAKERNKPLEEARETRAARREEQVQEERQRQVDKAAEEDEADARQSKKPTMLDGKPGAGSGLKPGDMFAPKSNPGAAARVPDQPLQPESLQSHGKGIIYDKDLDNPPYGAGDPEAVDEGPSGSLTTEQKKAERDKAEKATSRFKQHDPDNPTMGAGGRKDATASPSPIGSRPTKSDRAGGSNSGTGT